MEADRSASVVDLVGYAAPRPDPAVTGSNGLGVRT
jgi:hypothetical protein